MASKYTEAELDALELKMMNPDAVVKCPRCGNEITSRTVGNSHEAECKTEGCIKGCVRGL